jgi:hypothetical protein
LDGYLHIPLLSESKTEEVGEGEEEDKKKEEETTISLNKCIMIYT